MTAMLSPLTESRLPRSEIGGFGAEESRFRPCA